MARLVELVAKLTRGLERLGTAQGSTRALIAVLAGAALALGQSPFSLPLFMFAALPVLFALFAASNGPKSAALTGWFAGAGYFALALFWIAQPFLVDAERHGWMAPFAVVLMACGLALFWALAFAVARTATAKGYGSAAGLAACWMLAEYARSVLFTGFPWALIGYGWVETPVAQNAVWAGPHGLSLLTMLAGLSLAVALPRSLIVSAGLIAALWTFGTIQVPETAALRDDGFVVRLVQPNADQSRKWDADWVTTYYQRQLDYSAAASATPPNIIIWPETAVPFILGTSQGALGEIAAYARPARVILGMRELEGPPGADKLFNTLVLLDQAGAVTARYNKHHLVPFGEYIPYADWLSGLGISALAAENLFGFSAGTGPELIRAAGIPPFLPLICYEAIFPDAMQAPAGRAEWLVQITNDAWFGTVTGPYQHLAQARMRAIEQGLPLARAANTGISAMIDPYGRITHEIKLGEAGYVDAPLAAALQPTIYSRFGDLPALVAAALLIGLALPGRGRH